MGVDQAAEGRDRREARPALLEARRGRSSSPRATAGPTPPRTSRSRTRSRRRARPRCRRTTSSARSPRAPEPARDAAAYETVTYEGYGPGGVALFVEALTDNRNRTAADVRQAFTKSDGNLGESGSVAWLFERKGVILVDGAVDEDELMLAAADAGADDVEPDESSYRVHTAPESLHAVRAALEEGGLAIESAESTMVPKT